MNATRRTRLLIASNCIMLLLLIAIGIHEQYAQRAYNRLFVPPPRPYIFTDNTHFGEETDFYSLYPSHPAIVMLGTSMTRKMAWDELLRRCDVVNRGVNVDITDGILARVDYIIAMHPKIVFVEGGINDIDMSRPIPEIVGNIAQIARQLQDAGIIPVLTTVNHVTARYPESKAVNTMIAQLNAAIFRIAAKAKLEVVDLNPIIAHGNTLDTACARADGCHLTSKAYRVWKDQVEQILSTHGI